MLLFTIETTSKPKLNHRNWIGFSYGNKQYMMVTYMKKVTYNSTYLKDDTYTMEHEANAKTTRDMEM